MTGNGNMPISETPRTLNSNHKNQTFCPSDPNKCLPRLQNLKLEQCQSELLYFYDLWRIFRSDPNNVGRIWRIWIWSKVWSVPFVYGWYRLVLWDYIDEVSSNMNFEFIFYFCCFVWIFTGLGGLNVYIKVMLK